MVIILPQLSHPQKRHTNTSVSVHEGSRMQPTTGPLLAATEQRVMCLAATHFSNSWATVREGTASTQAEWRQLWQDPVAASKKMWVCHVCVGYKRILCTLTSLFQLQKLRAGVENVKAINAKEKEARKPTTACFMLVWKNCPERLRKTLRHPTGIWIGSSKHEAWTPTATTH